jgi:hypothetical protein
MNTRSAGASPVFTGHSSVGTALIDEDEILATERSTLGDVVDPKRLYTRCVTLRSVESL